MPDGNTAAEWPKGESLSSGLQCAPARSWSKGVDDVRFFLTHRSIGSVPRRADFKRPQ